MPASTPPQSTVAPAADCLGFRYVWPVKVTTRQLSSNETIILQISPKFATVHDHVSFQWSMKMHGTANFDSEDEDEPRYGDNNDAVTSAVVDGGGSSAEDGDERAAVGDYVAISLYYVDGPVSTVKLRANVRVVGEKERVVDERKTVVSVSRGRECELAYTDHREYLSRYIKDHVGQVIRLSLHLEMPASLFRTDAYLNAVSPTPIHSFLTANYRARASSKVWRRRSKHCAKRPRSASDGQPSGASKRLDLERTFNWVMERERSRRRLCEELSLDNGGIVPPPPTTAVLRRNSSTSGLVSCPADPPLTPSATGTATPTIHVFGAAGGENGTTGSGIGVDAAPSTPTRCTFFVPPDHQHLFKQLLVACCDSCERRASLITPAHCSDDEDDDEDDEQNEDDDGDSDDDADDEDEEEDEGDHDSTNNDETVGDGESAGQANGAEAETPELDTTFECPEDDKAEMHDALANMYFNKVVLPEMEYVEDFADFLIDAELNDLPVLKRACERYLCGELNTKKDLMTSLLLDLLFLSMVFHLPVMKSMTLTELCDRHAELEDVDRLLQQEEYRNLDCRIRQLCDRNLHDLIDECRRFREQRLRVHPVSLSSKMSTTSLPPAKNAREEGATMANNSNNNSSSNDSNSNNNSGNRDNNNNSNNNSNSRTVAPATEQP